MVEKVDLLEDSRPAVTRHLVNDLDSVLDLGVDVDTRLHDGIGPLAQHLPSQPIKLLEGVRSQRGRAGGLLLPAASLGCLLASSVVILLS